MRASPLAGHHATRSSSKALFVFCFFALWVILSVAILIRSDFYSNANTPSYAKNLSPLEEEPIRLLNRSKYEVLQGRQDRPSNGVKDDRGEKVVAQSVDSKTEGEVQPVLLSRTYTRRPENVEWQNEERLRVYPGSSPYQMHGKLESKKHFSWMDKLRVCLEQNNGRNRIMRLNYNRS